MTVPTRSFFCCFSVSEMSSDYGSAPLTVACLLPASTRPGDCDTLTALMSNGAVTLLRPTQIDLQTVIASNPHLLPTFPQFTGILNTSESATQPHRITDKLLTSASLQRPAEPLQHQIVSSSSPEESESARRYAPLVATRPTRHSSPAEHKIHKVDAQSGKKRQRTPRAVRKLTNQQSPSHEQEANR